MSRAAATPPSSDAGASAARRVPAPPHGLLERPGPLRTAREGLRAGMLWLVAPAGYGKTTLVGQAVAGDDNPPAWVSATDAACRRSPLRALADALGPPVVRRGSGARDGPPLRAESLCAALSSAFPDGVTLVVDDVHRLDARGVAELGDLAARLPGVARLVVAGRWRLPEALTAARPDGVTVHADSLVVDDDECLALLRTLGAEPSPEEAAHLRHESEGWPTGIVLSARPGGDPFGYLLREVVDPLPPAAARMLEDLHILERFTPELAAAVTGRADAADLLALAQDRGALVVPAAGGGRWLRLHRMLRAALERRATGRPPDELHGLHRRAADAWEAVGEPEAAARHHLAAGDLEGAVGALAPLARASGRRGPVRDLLRAVPARAWSDVPGPVLERASHLFYRADHLRAFDAMEGAARELADGGDRRRAAVVLVRLLRAAPLAGGLYERTIDTARELLPRIGSDPVLTPAALTMLGLILGESCRYEDAEAELQSALEEADGDRLSVARVEATRAFAIDFPQGRTVQAMAALDAAVPALDELAGDDVLNFILYALAFRSIILADLGRHEEALEGAVRLEDAAARHGLSRLGRPVSAVLRLVPLAGLGRLDELGTEVARAAPAARRLGGALRSYRHDIAAAQVAAAQGDRERLEDAVRDARAHLGEHGLPYDGAMGMADLAEAARAAGREEIARELAAEARVYARRAAAPWALARTAMVAAIAWGPGEEGDGALEEALQLSADPRMDELWSRRERAMADRLLARAVERGIGPPGTVARLTRHAGPGDEAPRGLPPAPAPPLAAQARGAIHLVTLGRFVVERDGMSVDPREFGRRKARTLLAILVCSRQAVDREALIEMLWPELPVERGLAALHSTLHALRRALEPAVGGPSPIVAEGTTYRLHLDSLTTWDAGEFLGAATRALAGEGPSALPALLHAEGLYAGSLLPEWPGAPWARELRTEVEEAHRRVVAGAADALSAAERHAEAIARYRLLLAMEPERESWHRAIMRIYAAAGERALALRQYHSCRTLLRDELGVEPSRATRELHTQILRSA